MARFDVFANPDDSECSHTPYFPDIQNDYIDGLETRVVTPLRTEASFGPRARHLNPMLDVRGDLVVLDTATLGAVPLVELQRPLLRLASDREAVQEALDTLLGTY